MKILIALCLLMIVIPINALNPHRSVSGRVIDENGEPLVGALVVYTGSIKGTLADDKGNFKLHKYGNHNKSVTASFMGYGDQTLSIKENFPIEFKLLPDSKKLQEVEVFGSRYKAPEKMDFLTRMPLRPSEQIQSISVISEKMIQQQGIVNIGEATQNVVGVTTFATYGGASESLTARGFRGIPILKNGIRIHSDFRGQGALMDMQGVESIQVIKGSAAVTQGIGNDIGSAGGTVNVSTKTPRFTDDAEVSLRIGSWWQVRPTFDIQRVFGKKDNFALRLNGAFERADSYRKGVSSDRIYINPSISWKLRDKTTFIAEMDYLHDSRTPDRGTVNLGPDSVNALYNMPHDKFLGFNTDRIFTDQLTYIARLNHKFNNNYSLRMAFVGSQLNTDNTGASTTKMYKNKEFNMLVRSLGRSKRKDQNQALQIDFVGADIYTGKFKHTFQAGIDFKHTFVETTSYKSAVIDTINVLENIPNVLPDEISLVAQSPENSTSYSYGLMGQYILSFADMVKGVFGGRYSFGNSIDNTSSASVSGNAFNPMIGLIISPFHGINIFGSFTNTTNLRSAANLKVDGTPIGATTTEQFEVGIKSEWFDHRLRANITLFKVMNRNLAYSIYDDAGQTTGRYDEAGDLLRRGMEFEIIGRPLNNMQVVLGYALLKAEYQNSPAYMDGSAPMNTPTHTANAWVHYNFDKGIINGLNIGVGTYYTGERPVGDYTKKTVHANTTPGVKPFDMKAHTILNASIGYTLNKTSLNFVFNNITGATGYSSYYRGGYINPINPFNMSATITQRF